MTTRLEKGATMSLATPYQSRVEPDPDRRPALPETPALRARALACLHQAALDRRLAKGAGTAGDRALTARAWQITRASARESLAATLDAILIDVDRPRPPLSARVSPCRDEVRVACGEIRRVAARLRDPSPVRPRGVALVRCLLTDGTGPLYVPSANDELYRQIRRAAAALDLG